jgi:glyceraldehyde 3-phosphate dehydrogenase
MSTQKTRVAINGFGRIGRAFLKLALAREDMEVIAVNDLGDIKNMAYLLKYDTVTKTAPFNIEVREGDKPAFLIDGKEILFVSQKDPALLPWRDLNIDIVVESTGLFTSYEKAKIHTAAGAKRVVISAPAKDDPTDENPGATVLLGINEGDLSKAVITSNASCTTNAGSPLMAILDEAIGIEKAVLNTVHGYTASQGIVDGPNKKDFREGRAGAMNIVPSSTGAAIAVTKVLTGLKGKFDGVSMRVPVVAGSIVDITFIAKRNTSKEEVNEILKKAATTERWSKTFSITEEELVSSDILGSKFASIADLKFTRVVDGNLVKVLGWYDNEMGYTHSLIEHVAMAGKLIS